jgi:RimJ/RimL family protein N-acetyltransferase
MRLPTLETERLRIRPFAMTDLAAIHEVMQRCFGAEAPTEAAITTTLERTREWLRWTVLGYEQLARLHQPPYGERAVVLQGTGALVGAVGFVPCLNCFGQLPGLGDSGAPAGCTATEFGLFWAIHPDHQRQGFATEAAAAMIGYALRELRLRRIVATTEYDNLASMRVMEKAGMRLERNPFPEPPWLQVVGIRENEG